MARQQVAALVLLESPRTAAYQQTCSSWERSFGLGSDQVNCLINKSKWLKLALFLALEPRFYRQKGASKNGEGKPTSYSWGRCGTLPTVATKRNFS